MSRCLAISMVAGLLFAVAAGAVVSGAEKSRFGTDVSEWSSQTPPSATVIPVGGNGQVNGNFVTGERNGVQIGIRAQRRFLQNVDPLPNVRDVQTGVYFAETGQSDAQGRAVWNYDIHVDLRSAFGVAKGKSLGDYSLVLDTDIGDSLFGFPVPLNIGEDFSLPDETLLFQTSQNPKFGNPPFDAFAEGTYYFALILTPKTFKGAPLIAEMEVVVVDAAD